MSSTYNAMVFVSLLSVIVGVAVMVGVMFRWKRSGRGMRETPVPYAADETAPPP